MEIIQRFMEERCSRQAFFFSCVVSAVEINSDKISGKSDSFFFCLKSFFFSRPNEGGKKWNIIICNNDDRWCWNRSDSSHVKRSFKYDGLVVARANIQNAPIFSIPFQFEADSLWALSLHRCRVLANGPEFIRMCLLKRSIRRIRRCHPGYWSRLEFVLSSYSGDNATLWFVIGTKTCACKLYEMWFTNFQLVRRTHIWCILHFYILEAHTMEAIQNKSISSSIQWN